MYKQIKNIDGSTNHYTVQHIESTKFIPFDPANTDYQAFLLWKSQGNEPLPADDPQP